MHDKKQVVACGVPTYVITVMLQLFRQESNLEAPVSTQSQSMANICAFPFKNTTFVCRNGKNGNLSLVLLSEKSDVDKDPIPVDSTSGPEFFELNIDKDGDLYIGGLPPTYAVSLN